MFLVVVVEPFNESIGTELLNSSYLGVKLSRAFFTFSGFLSPVVSTIGNCPWSLILVGSIVTLPFSSSVNDTL